MRKIIPVIASGVTALAIAGGTFGYAAASKSVTLTVDGTPRQVSTMHRTVAEVLSDQGVVVGAHDVVGPGPQSAITDGTVISVQYGRPLSITVDGKPQQVWTTAQTVGAALAALRLDASSSALSTSRSTSIGRQGLSMNVSTLKSIVVKQGKKTHKLTTTASTVAQVLAAAKITTDSDDQISLPATAPVVDGTSIRVVVVKTSKSTTTSAVDFAVDYRNTDKLTKGETKVDRDGRTGERVTTYTITRTDGKITEKKKLTSKIITEPVTKIVLVGTKKASSSGSNYASGNSVWDKLAKCESGGNWAINTGNGYSGGLQFSTQTWHAYGGSGKPYQASRAQQIKIAEKIRADVGYSAWPGCSSKLGLR